MVLCSSSSSSSITLPEYHPALCLLNHMDCHWFQDNILKPAASTACVSFCSTTASLSSASSATFLPEKTSPFRSIEMVSMQARSTPVFSRALPCSQFSALPASEMQVIAASSPRKDGDLVDGSNSSATKQLSVHLSIDRNQQDGNVPFLHARGVCTVASISQEALSVLDSGKEDTLSQVSSLQKEIQVFRNPNSPKHVAIVSGKPWGHSEPMCSTTRVARKNWQRSFRSVTCLNYEEQQDLDFHFSKYDLTPSMFDMFLTSNGEVDELGKGPTLTLQRARPLQNEGWLTEKSQLPLFGWRISAPTEDMKEQLKFWARAVACTVRQEC